jgi:hypothetical protein
VIAVRRYHFDKIGLHQGSTLRPYIFASVMDEVINDIRGDITFCMLLVDDMVLVDDSRVSSQ